MIPWKLGIPCVYFMNFEFRRHTVSAGGWTSNDAVMEAGPRTPLRELVAEVS